MYTIIDYYIVQLLSLYRSSNLDNMILIVLIELNNNVNGQLTLRLGKLMKLMKKTASVFWVDLGYRLRGRLRVLLQDFWGMTDIPYRYCYTVIVVPGGTSYFNTRSLGCGPGYVWDLP